MYGLTRKRHLKFELFVEIATERKRIQMQALVGVDIRLIPIQNDISAFACMSRHNLVVDLDDRRYTRERHEWLSANYNCFIKSIRLQKLSFEKNWTFDRTTFEG